jgi:hypothetical protein
VQKGGKRKPVKERDDMEVKYGKRKRTFDYEVWRRRGLEKEDDEEGRRKVEVRRFVGEEEARKA